MLDTIVRYLHDSLTPFRLASYPSAELVPRAAHPIPKHALFVETRFVLVGDTLALVCFAASDHIDLRVLAHELSTSVIEPREEDIPEALKSHESPPPLGQLYGFPVIVEEKVTRWSNIVFQPFGESDYVEIPYDDFARQEQPRVASFARGGDLPPAGQTERYGVTPM